MTARVGPKGHVVIPKLFREQLGIAPGDEVEFSLEDGVLRVEVVRPLSALRGAFKGVGLTGLLGTERRSERDK